MVRRLTVVVGLAMSLVVAREAPADPIGPGAFVSPTLITFEGAPDGRIDGRYSGLGVTFSELFGWRVCRCRDRIGRHRRRHEFSGFRRLPCSGMLGRERAVFES